LPLASNVAMVENDLVRLIFEMKIISVSSCL